MRLFRYLCVSTNYYCVVACLLAVGLVDSATAKRKHITPSPPHPQDQVTPRPHHH